MHTLFNTYSHAGQNSQIGFTIGFKALLNLMCMGVLDWLQSHPIVAHLPATSAGDINLLVSFCLQGRDRQHGLIYNLF